MVLSSFSFAFAANFEDVEGDYEEAINTLVALGVITGYEDGTYRPERIVTRAEMAKLIVEVLGYGDLVSGSASNFADTQGHWADAWIALAAGRGLVIGTGDGRFTPDRQVSYDEAITMVVRALGYTDNSNELKGMTWPTNFKIKAAELKLLDGVSSVAGGADRGGVAQLLFNALDATLVTVTTDGDVTFLQDTVSGDKVDRLLITRIATPDYDYDVTPDVLDEDNKNYGGDIVDLAPYMFQNLFVYLNSDDEVVYIRESNSLVLEGTVDKVKDDELTVKDLNGKKTTVVLNDDEEVNSNEIFENGAIRETNKDNAKLKDTDSIKVVAEDKDDDGKIDTDEIVGLVTTQQTKVVRIEQEYVDGKDKIDGLLLPDKVTVKGDADALEDIEEDDIVVEYLSEDEEVTTLVVSRDTVEGKVTRLADGDVYIDGKKYDIAKVNVVDVYELNDDGVFFLNHKGEVVDFDGSAEGPSDYAVVIGVANGNTDEDRFSGKESVDEYPSLKLATQDGEEVVYDIEVDVDDDGAVDEDDVAVDEDENPLVYDDDEDNDGNTLFVDTDIVDEDYLIQYKLNKDGRISEIKVIRNLEADNTYKVVDLDKATNAFADDAVIFDAGDDYAVVKESALPSDPEAYIVRNSSGQIEVLVAEENVIDSATDRIFVYIYGADDAVNDDDRVQWVDMYTGDADVSAYTTGRTTVDTDDVEGVFVIEYDGDDIDSAVAVTTSSALEGDEFVFEGQATRVNARNNMIEIDGEWYVLSDYGTVVIIDEDGEEDGLGDLNDITRNDTELVVFVNEDGEIDLILILE